MKTPTTNEKHLAFEWLRNLPLEGKELYYATILLKEIIHLNTTCEELKEEIEFLHQEAAGASL